MDALSQALRTLPMSGCLIARAELTAPWGMALDRFPGAVFHVILSGSCLLDPGRGRHMSLRAGDIAVLMQGQPHRLLSSRGVAVTRFADLMQHCVPGRFPAIGIAGGGDRATMLCGFFNFDRRSAHPQLRARPELIHVNVSSGLGLLDALVAMADAESGSPRPGSGALTDLLCGLLLVQVLRAQLAADPQAAAPWVHGLQDARIAAALELIHDDPSKPWTVAGLASSVAMSRSSFAPRFVECVGESPLRYVARCRILRAARLLDAEGKSVSEAMLLVGYQSESSFSKAFRRYLGCTPRDYRGRSERTALAS